MNVNNTTRTAPSFARTPVAAAVAVALEQKPVVGKGVGSAAVAPVPSAGRKVPFVGARIADQISRISMIAGTDPDTGTVAYTRKLSETDRFDKVGIFFEAESKVTPIDDRDVPMIKQAVLDAGDTGNFALLLPDSKEAMRFAGLVSRWDRDNSRDGADFHDMYGDDAKGSVAKANASARVRKIGDTEDGKLESKLPSSDVQGSAVLGRIECAKSIGPKRRSKDSLVKEAIEVVDMFVAQKLNTPDARAKLVATLSVEQKENPLVLLAVEVIDFDPRTYKDRLQVDDVRHQLVLKDPTTDKDMFLVTLDFVQAKRLDTGKVGSFVEFEIERMDGATNPAGLSELIALQSLVAQKLNLTKSPGPKNSRGWDVTE